MEKEQIDYDILITKYFDNTITSDEKVALTMWVRASSENENYFLQMAKAWEKSVIVFQNKDEMQKEANVFFRQSVRAAKKRLYRWIAGSAAAVLLLLVGLEFGGGGFLFKNKMLVVTSCDTKKEFLLPDGSKVWLNAQSRLEYPEKFDRSRTVTLKGEAFFDVKKSKEQSFSVHTEHLSIEVYGTTFLVADREESLQTEAILESGKINVTIKATGQELEMNPDRQLIYDKKEKSTEVKIVNAQNYTAWRHENLQFENVPLQDVFIQLSKWYNIRFVCNTADSRLLNTPVSFKLDNESVEEVLDILQQIRAFTWEKTSHDTIMIQ